MNEIILMSHVFFGVVCVLATLWVLVDTLNARPENLTRIRWMSRAVAGAMWLALLAGGYWYVVCYAADKAVILKGPWPWAHEFFMETKEHLVILLLLLATYLPVVTTNPLPASREARRLTLAICGLILLLGLLVEGHGAIIALGVKQGLLAKLH
jgi:ABC-type arginine transport system permease subunit